MATRRKLPAELHSSLGPITVTLREDLASKEDSLGKFNPAERLISIDAKSKPEVQLQAFWHEVTHAALWDAGAHNGLSKQQEERVCDAVGSFLASMMQAGRLRFVKP